MSCHPDSDNKTTKFYAVESTEWGKTNGSKSLGSKTNVIHANSTTKVHYISQKSMRIKSLLHPLDVNVSGRKLAESRPRVTRFKDWEDGVLYEKKIIEMGPTTTKAYFDTKAKKKKKKKPLKSNKDAYNGKIKTSPEKAKKKLKSESIKSKRTTKLEAAKKYASEQSDVETANKVKVTKVRNLAVAMPSNTKTKSKKQSKWLSHWKVLPPINGTTDVTRKFPPGNLRVRPAIDRIQRLGHLYLEKELLERRIKSERDAFGKESRKKANEIADQRSWRNYSRPSSAAFS